MPLMWERKATGERWWEWEEEGHGREVVGVGGGDVRQPYILWKRRRLKELKYAPPQLFWLKLVIQAASQHNGES